MDIQNSCAFTGHRPSHFSFAYDEKHPDCIAIKKAMLDKMLMLIDRGVTSFISGMALGADIWGAELTLELKAKHSKLQLQAALPCETQANRWSDQQRERYFNILSKCDKVVYVSRQYTRSCMFDRNRYMVDRAAFLLAVYGGGSSGGTAYTIQYAKSKQREIIIIPSAGSPKVIDFEEPR